MLLGCGVKGDPLPPEQAPRLGRGHPTFTRASEKVTLTPGVEDSNDDSDSDSMDSSKKKEK